MRDKIVEIILVGIVGVVTVIFVYIFMYAFDSLHTPASVVKTEPKVREYENLHIVFDKVREQSRYKASDITFYVVDDDAVNAYATTDENGNMVVVLFTGFIKFANGDEDKMAMIIGHEIAHHSLLHTKYQIDSSRGMVNEIYADLLGYEIAVKAGYDKCSAYQVWLMMSIKMFVRVHVLPYTHHPKPAYRAEYFKKLCVGDLK